MSDTRIERTAFTTSRLLDFVSRKELAMQCGYGVDSWPLVIVKELVDNALDACEEQGIAPNITVSLDVAGIAVADPGTGIPPDVVDRMLDFSNRVSSREAYVAPDRGAQGNALKTIIAMPFVLDGERGRVDIVGGGTRTEISFCVDRIEQRPAVETSRSCETGSLVRVHWPAKASSRDAGTDPFLQDDVDLAGYVQRISVLVSDFSFLNPHLTVTMSLFGETKRIEATDCAWQKWMPFAPTSAHWYQPEHLERLLGACITDDRQSGRERTVREFIAEFRGLSSTTRQAHVLAELGLARAPISSLIAGNDFDHDQVGRLLAAMKAQSKAVPPKALGVIGRSHLAARFDAVGIEAGSFEYRRVETSDEDGLPQVTEVAFAALLDHDDRRRLMTGVNWSAAWVNPFRTLGRYGQSLDTMLAERRFQMHQPIVVLVHVAHPRVEYTDRGKSTVLAQ